MNPSTSKVIDWYVVFRKSTMDHWIFNFLDSEIQHCYMVREDCGIWVIVEANDSHTEVRTELVDDYPHIRLLCPHSVIVPVSAIIDCKKIKWTLGIGSCVDICKGLLGINKFWLFTPLQLYRYING